MHVLPWVHVVLFALWIGGDLGVFTTSRLLRDRHWPPAARAALARAMTLTDLAPRTALVLILPTGLAMVLHRQGVSGPVIAGVVLLGGLWWGLALLAWRIQRRPRRSVTAADTLVRVLVGVALLGWGVHGLLGADLPGWLAVKGAAYGTCVLSGLMIRVRLRPFGPAFARIAAGAGTPEDDDIVDRSLGSAMPYVFTIWALVLLASFLGVVQPG